MVADSRYCSSPPGRSTSNTAICVADNGVGFDSRHAKRLFQPFERLHDAREFEGFGIGLATAARIIRRHGGRIWASSEPGEGAQFFVALPDA